MKKLFLFTITVSTCLAIILSGCAIKAEAFNDTSKTINTQIDQEFTIGLGSNVTTGYSWQPEYDAGAFTFVSQDYKADDSFGKYVVGAGGTEYFHFKATKVGNWQVSFTYCRPWETPNESVQTVEFNIIVK
jgi:inhibitor of cysteine peptidase